MTTQLLWLYIRDKYPAAPLSTVMQKDLIPFFCASCKAIRILNDLGIEIWASCIVRPEYTKEDFKAFRKYYHQWGFKFASFTVLTPLPGTEFYEEMKSMLLTDNYEFFDLIHTVLPTALPVKEFYKEYVGLIRRAIPFTQQLSLLKKYPPRGIIPTVAKSLRLQKRLRSMHLDYENLSSDQHASELNTG
ncbi:MAG: hypothetical protein JRI34_12730 [Deltaproteobacteria bacterium]|nr:hypothetical protein [Deltaproteobacteria bacterium]